MSLPDFPSFKDSSPHPVIALYDYYKRTLKWKLEHERLYYCIPKEKMDKFCEWLELSHVQLSFMTSKQRSIYADWKESVLGAEEKKKEPLNGF